MMATEAQPQKADQSAYDTTPDSVRRCLVLVNPKAGTLLARDFFKTMGSRITKALSSNSSKSDASSTTDALPMLTQLTMQAGLDASVEVAPALPKLPARIRAAREQGFDTIVAVGGDGTVRNVAQALVDTPMRLGILPMGTANNVAHCLGIPFELESAVKVLAESQERRIDVGRIGNEYFLEGAGVGLFADTIHALGADEARHYDIHRFLQVTLPLLWNLRVRALTLTLDGVTEQDKAIMVTVSNGKYLGRSIALTAETDIADGLFDVVIVGALTRREQLRFAFDILRGRPVHQDKVRYAKARTVEIRRAHRVHRPLPVHADDHIVGRTPVRMEVFPRALRVIAPTINACVSGEN